MARLGDPAGHGLLADKLATATALSDIGVPFPALRCIYRKGEAPRLPPDAEEGDLFVKPRHGAASRGAFFLTRAGGVWQMDGRTVTQATLLDRLSRAMALSDLLCQQRLLAAPDLADLAVNDRAPVLRVVTARHPGAQPFIHSALLSVGVPGFHPAHFLQGAVHAAVDLVTGRLSEGMSLGHPHDRIRALPWNGAPLGGRLLSGFGDAVAVALRAMDAVPPLAVVHWDFIPTAAGPIMLEGNTSGNWIIASLPGRLGLETCPLPPVLALWRVPR